MPEKDMTASTFIVKLLTATW